MFRLLRSVFVIALFAALAAAGWVFWVLKSTRPGPVAESNGVGVVQTTTLDDHPSGLTSIQATDALDAVRALGFAHGRDRFWSMDLDRRRASGRLAELLGEKAVPADREARLHGFARLAEARWQHLPADQQALLRNYTEGVNAGLEANGGTTWAHRLLRAPVEPWKESDCILVLDTLFLEIQGQAWLAEARAAEVRDRLGLSWVSALREGFNGTSSPLPGPKALDLQRLAGGSDAEEPVSLKAEAADLLSRLQPPPQVSGSVHSLPDGLSASWWQVAQLPSPLAPARLQYVSPSGPVTLTGLVRPGAPLFLSGTNGRITWVSAPAELDNADLVILPYSDIDPENLYAAGPAIKRIEERAETIAVRGEKPIPFSVRFSPWGPVVGLGEKKQNLSLRWAAHEDAALDFDFARLAEAEDLDEAVSIARGAALPPLHVLLSDGRGAPVTTTTGLRPVRRNMDGTVPLPWAYGDRGWQGWQDRDAIAVEPFAEPAATVEHDGFWWETLVRMAKENVPSSHSGHWDDLRRALRRAEAGSVEARAFARAYARRVTARALAPILRRVVERYPDFQYGVFPTEALVLRLLTERPAHLLDPRYTSWDDLLLNAADDVVADLPAALSSVDRDVHLLPGGLPIWSRWALRYSALAGRLEQPDQNALLEARFRFTAEGGLQVSLPGGAADHPLDPRFASFHAAWQSQTFVDPGAAPAPRRTLLQP